MDLSLELIRGYNDVVLDMGGFPLEKGVEYTAVPVRRQQLLDPPSVEAGWVEENDFIDIAHGSAYYDGDTTLIFAGTVVLREADDNSTHHELQEEGTPMTHHISASTLARTAALALALTNQVLSAVGKPILPIESAQLEQPISSGLTVAAALASWWNNNSFTPPRPSKPTTS